MMYLPYPNKVLFLLASLLYKASTMASEEFNSTNRVSNCSSPTPRITLACLKISACLRNLKVAKTIQCGLASTSGRGLCLGLRVSAAA